MEDSPSGLWRTLGKRVGVTASRVRISYPPPGFEPRKPLESFGFRGFALVPSDYRFPPGSLRFDTFGPDLPRVSHIGTDDSENAFEPSPAVRSSSKSDRAPCVPSVGRFESLHVLRAVFFVLVRNNPSLRIASASQRIPVGPARRFPLTPSDERHTNAYLNLGTLPTPLPRFLGTFLSTETTSQVRTMPSTKHPYRHIRQHITFAR